MGDCLGRIHHCFVGCGRQNRDRESCGPRHDQKIDFGRDLNHGRRHDRRTDFDHDRNPGHGCHHDPRSRDCRGHFGLGLTRGHYDLHPSDANLVHGKTTETQNDRGSYSTSCEFRCLDSQCVDCYSRSCLNFGCYCENCRRYYASYHRYSANCLRKNRYFDFRRHHLPLDHRRLRHRVGPWPRQAELPPSNLRLQ